MARAGESHKAYASRKSGGQSFYKYFRALAESGQMGRSAANVGHVALQQMKRRRFFVMPIKCY
jgi:hypothetical protein